MQDGIDFRIDIGIEVSGFSGFAESTEMQSLHSQSSGLLYFVLPLLCLCSFAEVR